MRIGIIFGGPSKERGISLNSARTLMDHLIPLGWEIVLLYCDTKCKIHLLSDISHLYSNTPSDFDFKLNNISKLLSTTEFLEACHSIDIVFPIIHGKFGEDGTLQELLEINNIPFVGSSSASCKEMFDKVKAKRRMSELTCVKYLSPNFKKEDNETKAEKEKNCFFVLPDCCIEKNECCSEEANDNKLLEKVNTFFDNMNVDKVVVKPSAGGSSIGVGIAKNAQEAISLAKQIFEDSALDGCAMIEPYCKGKEFTIFVLENFNNSPVSLIPAQIDIKDGEIYTFRKKYLPSDQIIYFNPPHFDNKTIVNIQKYAEKLFEHFKMRDFARIDGWVTSSGEVVFSDINPLSGLNPNGSLFINGSYLGLCHEDILKYIIKKASIRYTGLDCSSKSISESKKQKVFVLFGGKTSERQVSVMSGTNVWLKLRNEIRYEPYPYILSMDNEIWEVPYNFALHSTVEEIMYHCSNAKKIYSKLKSLVPPILEKLGLSPLKNDVFIKPRQMTLEEFCKKAVEENAFVFIALHGGCGENGQLQAKLNQYKLAYNGSDEKASQICMDKYRTGKIISNLSYPLLISLPKICIPAKPSKSAEKIWSDAVNKLQTSDLIIKPRADGCTTGILRLKSPCELENYLTAIRFGKERLLDQSNNSIIELPKNVDDFILEPFIQSDRIIIEDSNLILESKDGWVELTVGILENMGCYHALSPSITIAEENILSVEEKFQGGTGVNLTPPPEKIFTQEQGCFIEKDMITKEQVYNIKKKIKNTARVLEINGYARIDIFFNIYNNEIIIIEANTLPGLTPSTVIYHQALAEGLNPQKFLSEIIEEGIKRRQNLNNAGISKKLKNNDTWL
jgi:D-alanine-D-alanine ligase-like ATP-grasp enzyme